MVLSYSVSPPCTVRHSRIPVPPRRSEHQAPAKRRLSGSRFAGTTAQRLTCTVYARSRGHVDRADCTDTAASANDTVVHASSATGNHHGFHKESGAPREAPRGTHLTLKHSQTGCAGLGLLLMAASIISPVPSSAESWLSTSSELIPSPAESQPKYQLHWSDS
jgi:hypothetical protein